MTLATSAAESGPPDLDWHVDLTEEERQTFRHDWGDCTDKKAKDLWSALSVSTRWHFKCAQEGRDGSLERELQRLSDNVDPETAAAFNDLLPPPVEQRLELIAASTVRMEQTSWAWRDRIPLGERDSHGRPGGKREDHDPR